MEKVHQELADAGVKEGLVDMMQLLQGGAIKQDRARVTKLRRKNKEPSSEVKVVKQM